MYQSYFHAKATTNIEFAQTDEIQTIVQKAIDHPMAEMAQIFDSTFEALTPLLEAENISPVGAGFSLHHHQPTDTATFEVGLPVNKPLPTTYTTESGVVLEPSSIPAGEIARISHIGPYDALPQAWNTFMDAIAAAGKKPKLPFWEVYVTEPTPDMDTSTLRTDLVCLIEHQVYDNLLHH